MDACTHDPSPCLMLLPRERRGGHVLPPEQLGAGESAQPGDGAPDGAAKQHQPDTREGFDGIGHSLAGAGLDHAQDPESEGDGKPHVHPGRGHPVSLVDQAVLQRLAVFARDQLGMDSEAGQFVIHDPEGPDDDRGAGHSPPVGMQESKTQKPGVWHGPAPVRPDPALAEQAVPTAQ